MAELSTKVITVTPGMAKEWLDTANIHNRKLRAGLVSAMTRDMLNGNFHFNGDSIRFSADGTLLDGQHRLTALVAAGVSAKMLIVEGLAPQTQDTIDRGAKRTYSDQLMLRGEENTSTLAAIARRCVLINRNHLTDGAGADTTAAEIHDYIDAHPTIRRAAKLPMLVKANRLPVPGSALATAFHVCSLVDDEAGYDAEIFFVTQVIEGLGLEIGFPAKALRDKFTTVRSATGRNIIGEDAYRFAVLAWNKYRAGDELMLLRVPLGGWKGKPIPQPR
jgi:hypothetical protein